MENVMKIKVLFGGLKKFNKKDKVTGVKLAEESAMVQILQIDTINDFVENKTFFISLEDYDKYLKLKLKPLQTILISIEVSVTSAFTKLVDISLEDKIQNKI